jgi:hypothetical protein
MPVHERDITNISPFRSSVRPPAGNRPLANTLTARNRAGATSGSMSAIV